MRPLELLDVLNKHRPRTSEVFAYPPRNDDIDEVKRFMDKTERLFHELWESEEELLDSVRFSRIPFFPPRFSRASLERVMACLSNMREEAILSQERHDIIMDALKDVPSYQSPRGS